MTGPSRPESITLHEAADRLGVHYMTVYRYVRLGMLPAEKSAGTWKVDPADLPLVRAAAGGTAPAPARRPRAGGRSSAPWSDRLRTRMLAGDVEGSWHVVE